MKFFALCSLLVALLVMPVWGQERANQTPPVAAQQQADAPFAAEIAAFEAADKQNPPPPGGVLFIGSSSIRLWTTLARDFPDLPVINRGFGGSQIADSVRYVDRIVLPYKPKMVVMYAGTNDLNAGKSPAQVLKDFQAFVDAVQGVLPDTHIVFISINPSVARWNEEAKELETNRLIRRYIRATASKTRKLSYLDSHRRLLSAEGKPQPDLLRTDGLHLNVKGYEVWTAILKPQIMALWKADTQ